MLADGQQRGHHRIAALHDEIGDEIEQQGAQILIGRLLDIHQIAAYDQKDGHVEGIDHLLGIGIGIANEDQMKTDHQDNQQAFQIV